MCRHLAYLGPPVALAEVVTRPPGGLYEQSWAPRRQTHGTVNADGFGLGWYPADGEPPARYRRAVPVWADPNLPDLARAVRSGAVLAAVRDATPGTAQDETAAAPYAAGGRLFSHNGAVPDWQRLPADLGEVLDAGELLDLEARCDSALLWALLAARLRAGADPEQAMAALAARVAEVRPGARLNFLLTDGSSIVATRRGDSLWYRTGPGGVLVASEPDRTGAGTGTGTGTGTGAGTGAAGGWREVPEDHVLTATATSVRTVPLVTAAERIPTA